MNLNAAKDNFLVSLLDGGSVVNSALFLPGLEFKGFARVDVRSESSLNILDLIAFASEMSIHAHFSTQSISAQTVQDRSVIRESEIGIHIVGVEVTIKSVKDGQVVGSLVSDLLIVLSVRDRRGTELNGALMSKATKVLDVVAKKLLRNGDLLIILIDLICHDLVDNIASLSLVSNIDNARLGVDLAIGDDRADDFEIVLTMNQLSG
mmetsp:Transcript_54924/g.76109  ORF Transcript_54924/g.76109 Transcript_54924/m.76109 type:complete len:207 (+) Transcript_54924:128-748(+)